MTPFSWTTAISNLKIWSLWDNESRIKKEETVEYIDDVRLRMLIWIITARIYYPNLIPHPNPWGHIFLRHGLSRLIGKNVEYLRRNARERTFWHVRPRKTQISLCFRSVWPESSIPFILGYPKCAHAQTDPNLRWMHVSDGTFSDVAVHLVKQRLLWINNHGPVVQSTVSLTSSLVVKTLTIPVSTSNLLVFLLKKYE